MTPHNERVTTLVAKHRGAQTKGFRIAVREAVRPSMIEEWGDEPELHRIFNEEAARDLWLRPDLYLIAQDAKLVICWEVEHRHRYTAHKYNTVFWFLDEFRWRLKVITVDAIYGGHQEIDLIAEVYKALNEERDEAPAG